MLSVKLNYNTLAHSLTHSLNSLSRFWPDIRRDGRRHQELHLPSVQSSWCIEELLNQWRGHDNPNCSPILKYITHLFTFVRNFTLTHLDILVNLFIRSIKVYDFEVKRTLICVLWISMEWYLFIFIFIHIQYILYKRMSVGHYCYMCSWFIY